MITDPLREAEVDELDAAGAREDRVGRLDVAVEDAPLVRRREARREAARDVEEHGRGERARDGIQAAAVDVFQHEIGPAARLADAVNRDDVGVVDAGQGARFEEEAARGAARRAPGRSRA